jgi:hypothetical protein
VDEILNKSAPESSQADSRKWISRIVIAVVLGEAVWGCLVSITNNLALPAMARVMGGDPQSPLYLGKGDVNVQALFISVLELCFRWDSGSSSEFLVTEASACSTENRAPYTGSGITRSGHCAFRRFATNRGCGYRNPSKGTCADCAIEPTTSAAITGDC